LKISQSMEKIFFRFFSTVLDEYTVETLWAAVVDTDKGLYKIDNIPFYAAVAPDDLVLAEFDDDEQMLTYRETIEFSCNSIVQVVLMDENKSIDDIRAAFSKMGCDSEKLNEGYFSMEIPCMLDYSAVRKRLNELEEDGTIGYAEPYLSQKHQ
jgi:hypothetical protein